MPQDEESKHTLLQEPDEFEEIHFSEKHQQPPRRKSCLQSSLRLIFEITLVLIIIALLIQPLSRKAMTRPSPVPVFPTKKYTFVPQPRYLHEDMFSSEHETLTTLHNWIELSADGRGYVKIQGDPESFDLPESYSSYVNATYSAPVYMMSVFHQLHCLSYLAEHFSTSANRTQEIFHHSAHCFDYIRQSIMCNADTSLEGKTEAGPGWGSEHVCKDYDEILKWANSNDVYKWRGLLPDEAVL